jgi:hypothetical protein
MTFAAALLWSIATILAHGDASAAPALSAVEGPAPQTPPPAQQPPRSDQDRPAPIRVSVDVVAVDVQVIDREGKPVPDLGPEKFTVTINGRRRRVISAERIASDTGVGTAPPTATAASMRGRVIVIAASSRRRASSFVN